MNCISSVRYLCAPCQCTVAMILPKHVGMDWARARGRVERGGTGQAQGTRPARFAPLHTPPRDGWERGRTCHVEGT
jgi:hypothetical protein